MGHLIDDLLALSQTGRVAMQTRRVDLDQLVREVQHELIEDTDQRQIVWEVAQLPSVNGDPALLRQVVVNLLSNAIKFTASRSDPQIRVGVLHQDVSAPAERVCIYVQDNGVGFDPQYTHNLFGVFQRLHHDDEFEGTGIGLATVRRIALRHGGETWAEGQLDQGATFYFTLPRHHPDKVTTPSS
jgi:light-regulated signal transduction histidine kinase (bacteriophytochrome)